MKKLIFYIALFISFMSYSYGQDGWTTTNLSAYKYGMGATVLGSKVYFAGGLTPNGATNKVEIYDNGSWTYLTLPYAKTFISAVSCQSKVFFAGGMNPAGSAWSTVDIYDTLTHIWTTVQLSQARFAIAAVSNGHKVIFAGGGNLAMGSEYDAVDIYDADLDVWTTASLSQARTCSGAVVGDLALFAGGWLFSTKTASDRVDIYNFSTGQWSTASLSQARNFIGATTVGNKVLFAGGENALGVPSKRVDIYDASRGTWSIDSLSVARGLFDAATLCGKAYFVGGHTTETQTQQFNGDFNVIDIYDAESGHWEVEHLPYNLFAHSTISTEDQLFVAGGGTIIEPNIQLRNVVRILSCTTGINDLVSEAVFFSVYPNPVTNLLNIAFAENFSKVGVSIFDMTGKIVYTTNEYDIQNIGLNVEFLPEGVYIIQINNGNRIQSQKVIVAK